MPIYIQFSAQGQNLNTGKSQIYAMAHRRTAITPGNLRQMGFRMGAESYSSHLPEGGAFGQGVTAPIDSPTGQLTGGLRKGGESHSSHLPKGGGFGQGVTAPIDSSTGQLTGGFRKGAESHSSYLPKGGAFGQGVTAPIDSSTGQFSGKRQHSPLVIHMAVDSNSPLLVATLQRNSVIPSLELNLIQTTPQGISRTIGTFNLIDASLAGYGREPIPHDYPKPPPTIKREPPTSHWRSILHFGRSRTWIMGEETPQATIRGYILEPGAPSFPQSHRGKGGRPRTPTVSRLARLQKSSAAPPRHAAPSRKVLKSPAVAAVQLSPRCQRNTPPLPASCSRGQSPSRPGCAARCRAGTASSKNDLEEIPEVG